MITGHFPVEQLRSYQTPFYYYDLDVLRATLTTLRKEAADTNWCVHYAVKACATFPLLKIIFANGVGADCVSGGEIKAALQAGCPPQKIVFAGVAKTDNEIRYALEQGIFSFNVESTEELMVISEIAASMNLTANICIRVNPNIDAHTHDKITTGLNENKFGISINALPQAVQLCYSLPALHFIGLHFHIGSQITSMQPFQELALKVNELVTAVEHLDCLDQNGCLIKPVVQHINVGGGLGILYEHPNHFPIPDFADYFSIWRRILTLRKNQFLHFELGRSIVAQCGSLMTRVLYVKHGENKQFAIVDSGMTDLIRPALYGAYHRVENLTHPNNPDQLYDIVGPICESSDIFAKDYAIAQVQRGDLLALRSAGAYGEIMASQYNLRRLPGHVTSDELL